MNDVDKKLLYMQLARAGAISKAQLSSVFGIDYSQTSNSDSTIEYWAKDPNRKVYTPPNMPGMRKNPWMVTAAHRFHNMGMSDVQIRKCLKAMRKVKVREELAKWEEQRQERLRARQARREKR